MQKLDKFVNKCLNFNTVSALLHFFWWGKQLAVPNFEKG